MEWQSIVIDYQLVLSSTGPLVPNYRKSEKWKSDNDQ